MWARTATGQVLPGKMDDFIKVYKEVQQPIMEKAQGIQSVRLLTDTSTNKAVAVSIWATESDAKASGDARSVEDVVKRFEGVIAGAPTFEYYEVSADY